LPVYSTEADDFYVKDPEEAMNSYEKTTTAAPLDQFHQHCDSTLCPDFSTIFSTPLSHRRIKASAITTNFHADIQQNRDKIVFAYELPVMRARDKRTAGLSKNIRL
jgi:hypothetical protein